MGSKHIAIVCSLLAAFTSGAVARPVIRPDVPISFEGANLGRPEPPGRPAAYGAAGQDTVYFGGTFWNPDSSRWEAIRDSVWTFDSGVGSSFNHDLPGVDPYKDPSLHATMEGWIGIDETYVDAPYFRRVAAGDFGASPACVGAAGGLGGQYSLWAGVLPAEAGALCYANAYGYGNNWTLCIAKPLAYDGTAATLEYDFHNDTEPGYDFTRVYVDSAANGHVEVISYTGASAGHETLTLNPGVELPATPGTVTLRFCVETDGAWSDEDGLYTSACGAFAVDDILLTGGITDGPSTFETGDDGWVLRPSPPGTGEWSNLVFLSNLPDPLTACPCNLADSVLVFENMDAGGHGVLQDNLAASPWIDLKREGLVGTPGKFIEAKLYALLPALNYTYTLFRIQYYPGRCPTGDGIATRWTTAFHYYYGGVPTCTHAGGPAYRMDFSALVPPEAEQIRIAVGVVNLCFYMNCDPFPANSSPWYDDVRLGVYGTPGAPLLAAREVDLPQDAFPTNGTLYPAGWGRIDCNNVHGAVSPEAETALGDTLVVEAAGDDVEVYVQFAVRPGPFTDDPGLQDFFSRVHFQETRRGRNWYGARMDTAEVGGYATPGTWMTAFHEEDPSFTGLDTDTDPDDPDPHGRFTRLRNDIFPDNLFTPGSRLEIFYKARHTAGASWHVYPDTAGGNYLEAEVLPSSLAQNGEYNCILYVNHTDEVAAQRLIEAGLGQIYPDGSANPESTAWDRWDVRAPSSQQMSFGRPLNTEYGATVPQALGYNTILWSTGDEDAFNLSQEDGAVLIPWLTLLDFSGSKLYLTGDDLASSITAAAGSEPNAARLLTDILGVLSTCSAFHDEDCPPGTIADAIDCVTLEPVTGARVTTRPFAGTHLAQGSGCPQLATFDVLARNPDPDFGSPLAEERYSTGAKLGRYASISNIAYLPTPADTFYQGVVDGVSLHHRRDPGDCAAVPGAPPQAIVERLTEVLGDLPNCHVATTGIPGPPPEIFRTALLGASPNPLRRGAGTRIRFTLERDGPVTLAVYDLRGARLRVLLDGPGTVGENEAVWDGKDASGRPVAQGVYFYRLTALGKEFHRKLVVLGR